MVDYFILTEMSKNFDGYRSSTFLFKKKSGKLHIGPVWDNDLAWGNMSQCTADSTGGWQYNFGDYCSGDGLQIPFWWKRFYEDKEFHEKLVRRWTELSITDFSTARIYATMDSLCNIVQSASEEHFRLWDPGAYVFTATASRSWSDEIRCMKKWIAARMDWLDANIR